MNTLPRLSTRQVELVAILALIIAVISFQATEIVLLVRLAILVLLIPAVALALSGRDRVFPALFAMYAGSTVLLSLFLSLALPSFIVFPGVYLLAALLLTYLAKNEEPTAYLLGLGGGLATVELLYFLTPWPFDPQSKAILLTTLVYIIWLVTKQEGPIKLKDMLSGGIWLSILLVFVLWFAEWTI